MSTFVELLHGVKEICDRKDAEISSLQNKIDLLLKERRLIAKRLKEGNIQLVIDYLT